MGLSGIVKYLAGRLICLSGLRHSWSLLPHDIVTVSQDAIMVSVRFLAAAATVASLGAALDPAAVYDGGYGSGGPILLGIGNGGAGQSGLIKGNLDL